MGSLECLFDALRLAEIGGHRQATSPSRIGGRMPLYCTAIGKSLLWAIESRIGASFTPRVCDAWMAFLAVVVSILRPAVTPQRSRAA